MPVQQARHLTRILGSFPEVLVRFEEACMGAGLAGG